MMKCAAFCGKTCTHDGPFHRGKDEEHDERERGEEVKEPEAEHLLTWKLSRSLGTSSLAGRAGRGAARAR